jgi:hypothetical protein
MVEMPGVGPLSVSPDFNSMYFNMARPYGNSPKYAKPYLAAQRHLKERG